MYSHFNFIEQPRWWANTNIIYIGIYSRVSTALSTKKKFCCPRATLLSSRLWGMENATYRQNQFEVPLQWLWMLLLLLFCYISFTLHRCFLAELRRRRLRGVPDGICYYWRRCKLDVAVAWSVLWIRSKVQSACVGQKICTWAPYSNWMSYLWLFHGHYPVS